MITLQDIRDAIDHVVRNVRSTADGVLADDHVYHLKIGIQDVWYNVDIQATEDPLDSESKVTDDPAKALAEFFSSEVPGGEFFDRMSFTPEAVSGRLRVFAARVRSGSVNLSDVMRHVRRTAASCGHDVVGLGRTAARLLRLRLANDELRTVERRISETLSHLRERGWSVSESKTEYGQPAIRVNIGDRYDATIEVNSITYGCEYEVVGFPETRVKLETDDPIRELRTWSNRPDVDDAVKVRRESGPGDLIPDDFPDDAKTIPTPGGG